MLHQERYCRLFNSIFGDVEAKRPVSAPASYSFPWLRVPFFVSGSFAEPGLFLVWLGWVERLLGSLLRGESRGFDSLLDRVGHSLA